MTDANRIATAYADLVTRCTCPGGWNNHNDETDCPNKPEAIYSPHLSQPCQQHDDPEPKP